MNAEILAPPSFAIDSLERVSKAYQLGLNELLFGRCRAAYAARAALLYRLRYVERRSRHECSQALCRRDKGRGLSELAQTIQRYAYDPELRGAFVLATEGP